MPHCGCIARVSDDFEQIFITDEIESSELRPLLFKEATTIAALRRSSLQFSVNGQPLYVAVRRVWAAYAEPTERPFIDFSQTRSGRVANAVND